MLVVGSQSGDAGRADWPPVVTDSHSALTALQTSDMSTHQSDRAVLNLASNIRANQSFQYQTIISHPQSVLSCVDRVLSYIVDLVH